MPNVSLEEHHRASLTSSDAVEPTELDDGLEISDKLMDVFADKKSEKHMVAGLDAATDDEDVAAHAFGHPVSQNGDGTDDHIMHHAQDPDKDAGDHSDPHRHSSLEADSPGEPESHLVQPHKHDTPIHDISAAAAAAAAVVANDAAVDAAADAVADAASAAALVEAVSSGIGSANIGQIPLTGEMQANVYHSFVHLAPNTTSLLGHPLAPMSVPATRRAVRIAPMGSLALPPHGSNSLVPDLPGTSNSGLIVAAPVAMRDVSAMEVHLGPPAIGEMQKRKRRGVSGAASSVPGEGLTPEEHTKQKRMLRNRESAARSRDKRRTKDIRLKSNIEKHGAKRQVIEKSIEELRGMVEAMENVLNRHKISLPA